LGIWGKVWNTQGYRAARSSPHLSGEGFTQGAADRQEFCPSAAGDGVPVEVPQLVHCAQDGASADAIAAGGVAMGARSLGDDLEAGQCRPLRAFEDLSDLPLVGRAWPQGQVGRPAGAGGLLYDHPGPDEPNSNYYLAINTGFPNSFDRANGRTGDFLMIHGDCSSAGCYAMTDEQIAEIYALARESFFGGQKAFQIQPIRSG